MKFIKIFLFVLIAFFSVNFISNINILDISKVEAAAKPDLTMSVSGPTLVVKDQARSYDFTTTSSGGFFSGLAPVMTNLIQTATGIADPNNPTGVINSTYTYNVGGTLRDNDPLLREQNVTFSTVGTSYLRACADKNSPLDANGVIYESDEKNNCSSWIPITIIASPFVDLQTSSINTPSVTVGVPQYFDATIYNRGPGFTNYLGINSFQNQFQSADGFDSFPDGSVDYSKPVNLVIHPTTLLSQVRVLSPEGTFIREYNNGVTIRWQDRAVVSQSITLNNIGTNNYIRACADINKDIVESDDNNNCGPWTQITVSPASGAYKINVIKAGTGLGTVISESGSSSGVPGTPNSYINCGLKCSEDISNLPVDPKIISSDGRSSVVIHLYPNASDGSFFAGWGYPDSYTNSDVDKMNEVDPVESTAYIPIPASMDIKFIPVFNLNDVPSVACSNVKNVTQNSATIECSMVREGVNVAVSGVVWGSPGIPPTLLDSVGKTTDGATRVRGSWTSTITGLTPGTSYAVRGYATNSIGTGYGGMWQFKTLSATSSSGVLSISPSTCKIALNESACTVTGAIWNTTNAVSPALIDGNTSITLSNLANNDVNPIEVWVSYPQTVFNLQDGIIPLDSKIVTAKCVTGTGWDSTNNKCVVLSADSLDGLNCEIKKDQSTCKTIMTLNIASPVVGAETNVTTNIPVFNTEVIKNKDIGSFPSTQNGIVVSYPDTTFFLNHNTLTVAEKTLKATCELGTSWDVASGKCIETIIGDVDGVWGESTYGSCGGCDVSGDNGTQTVNRSCIGPIGNGKQCVGLSSYSQSCSCKGGSGLISSFTASPEKIYKGRYTTLDWDSNADNCSIVDGKGITLDTKNKKKGNIQISPLSTTNYNLTCSKGGVTETKQINVKVINVTIIEG